MTCLKARQCVAVFTLAMPLLAFVACKTESGPKRSEATMNAGWQQSHVPRSQVVGDPNPRPDGDDSQLKTQVMPAKGDPDADKYAAKIEKEFAGWREQGFFDKTTGTDGSNGGYGVPSDIYTCGASAPDCKSKFVRLYMQSRQEGMSCTGVLISSDLVLTNRHCFPFLDAPNTTFGGYSVNVVLPDGIMVSAHNVSGLTPKWASFVAGPSVDFALVKIDKTFLYDFNHHRQLDANPYQAPEISHEGLRSGETYYVYSTTPYSNDKKNQTVIEKRPCKAIYNTIFGAHFQSQFSPVVILADCPIGPGNSGSPIYNADGKLVGLISGQLSPKSMQALSSVSLDFKMVKEPFHEVGWGTNLACLPSLVGEAYTVPKECNAYFETISSVIDRKLPQNLVDEATQMLTHDMKDNQFEYQIAQGHQGQKFSDYITPLMMLRIPKCADKSLLDNNDKISIKTEFVALQVDADGAVMNQLTNKNEETLDIDFNRSELRSKGEADIMASMNGFLFYEGKLRICD